jgi:hypothetical protein
MTDLLPWFVFDLICVALTVRALMLAWFRGSLFAGWRAYFEARGGPVGHLLTCPLCLSFHLASSVFLLTVIPPYTVVWILNKPDLWLVLRLVTGWPLYVPAAATVGWQLAERWID